MKRILSFIIPLITVGCTQSYEDVDAISTSEEFYATIEVSSADTRTYVDENITTRWHADDRLTIFKKETYHREYKFKGKTGENSGGFTQVSVDDDFYSSETLDKNYAIYPHSNDNRFIKQTESFEITMPAEQTYAENTFGRGANTMVAVSETGQLLFKNVGSFLRVRLWGEDTAVSSITITSNGDEVIAGEATVKPTLGGDPTCVMTGSTKSITLNCPTPVTISKSESTPTDFWIVLPPVTFENGFTVTVKDSNDSEQTYDVDKSFTFARNTYYNLKREVTICEETTQPTEIPNNQIWYTSTDGQIVTPNKTDVFGANIVSNVYENDKGVITFDGKVSSIGDSAFSNCTTLKNITIPDSVVEIGFQAFSSCGISSIAIPNSVAKIKEDAFKFCSHLSRITLPENISEISNNTFYYCTNLKEINIPKNVTIIGEKAFYTCENLTNIILPNSITNIGKAAFSYSGITNITIPDKVGRIEYETFKHCANLVTVTLNENLIGIDASAFYWCDKLDNIIIPSKVTSIGVGAFHSCASLSGITIPDSVTEIGRSALSYCPNLKIVTIGKAVTEIGMDAFEESGIISVYSKPLVPPLLVGGNAFSNNAIGRKIYVPSDAYDAYIEAWSQYANDIVCDNSNELETPPNNQIWYTSSDGNIVEPNNSGFYGFQAFIKSNVYENGKGIITFDRDVTEIGLIAFNYCQSLTSITIPNTVISIGEGAFSFCESLTSINIPDGVKSIEKEAFKSCRNLKDITIPNSVTSIGENAFSNCMSITKINIPNGLTKIEKRTYYGCSSLTSITIPESVTSIGEEALNCFNSINVYCKPATPPILSSSALWSTNNTDCKIYVPTSSVDTYKAADGWKDYAEYIEGYNF